MSNIINSIPEDYDDDDYQPSSGYQQPYHSNSSIPDSMYEDKSKFRGLRQTSLSQIDGKKRYRPPTVITPLGSQQAVRSPSLTSFQTNSSGDRHLVPQQLQHSQYPPPPQQQQQYMYQYYPQQQQQHRPHYHPQQQQQYFQPPIHYGQFQRSGNSLVSPVSSNFQSIQPPLTRRYDNQSAESLTPSSSFDRDNELPITPESLEEQDSLHESVILDLNSKKESLMKENNSLNDKISTLTKLLNDKEQELQLKNNIIEAKTKQLNLREEKLNNRDKQIEILNKRISSSTSIDEDDKMDEEKAKLLKTNKELSAKVISLLTEVENLKSNEHDKLVKVNKDLSLKIVSLLEDIELLRSEQQVSSPNLLKHPPSMGVSSPKLGNGNKTIKDLSKEELFKSEFSSIVETLIQNESYYENKIKTLQENLEDHKKMIKNISSIKKNITKSHDPKRGLKVINIVPSTL